ncbi:MAG TPA: hypothetical protein PLO08_15190, partial [Alicycliphilus sp.]|nr:hypothetical protein [Alicycliphilus sp.]
QQADGQWKLVPDGDAVVTTALAVQTLTLYRQQPAIRAVLDLPPVDVPIRSGSPGSRLLDGYVG